MNSVKAELSAESGSSGQGFEELARDIETFIAYSETTRTRQDVRRHIQEDPRYFEDDLEHVNHAIDYLRSEGRIHPDVKQTSEMTLPAFRGDYTT